MLRWDVIWKYDIATSTWTSLTNLHKTNSTITFIANTNEIFYFGMNDRRFIGLLSTLATNGSYGILTYEYYNGVSWETPAVIDSYRFNTSKFFRFALPENFSPIEFTATFPYVASPPDNKSRYWLRVSAASVTTAAVVNKFRCLPYATYTTPDKIASLLNLKKKFDMSTNPSFFDVERYINNAESRIDYRTQKSWKFNYITGEEHIPEIVDYNRYGIYPRYRDLIDVYQVAIWNGSTFNTLDAGRTADYFVDHRRGMIYFTRLFLLPAMYGITGRYFHYGFGEFKASVQLDYSYGRDMEIDPEFSMVNSLATKLVCLDTLMGHDYSVLTVSSTDKILLSEKARLWSEETERSMDELTAVRIY